VNWLKPIIVAILARGIELLPIDADGAVDPL